MQASRDMVPVVPLLATVMAIAALTSAVWWGVWQRHDHRQSAATAALEQELAHVRANKQQLASRLDTTRESRHEQALELQRLGDQLQSTRRQLKALEAENWPARHAQLEQRNYELSEQVAELEVRNSMTRDNYAADFERLQGEHEQLQQDYSDLKAERTALQERLATIRHEAAGSDARIAELQQQLAEARAFANAEITALQAGMASAAAEQDTLTRWRRTLEHDLITSEIRSAELTERLAAQADEHRRLQTRLAVSEEQIRTLRSRNNELTAKLEQAADAAPPTVQSIQQQPRAQAVATKTGDNQANSDASGFRLARLESLKSTLADSNTANRKAILLTVLPTIPDGVRGNELAPLLDGMRTDDIVAVIRNSRAHIRRPVDNDGYERIMRHLADEAARRTVTRLLQ